MSQDHKPLLFDKYLVAAVIALMALGLIMVASASMVISERQFGQPFHYFIRQLIYMLMGIVVIAIAVRFEVVFWQKLGGLMLLLGMFLLLAVLVPGIGHQVNGSRRWIGFGFLNLQVSEFIKLAMVLYLAGYLVRRNKEVKSKIRGFLKPMVVLGIVAILLLKEPDFGALVVVGVTTLVMMYMAGVKVWQFAVLVLVVAIAFAILAISSPYRLQRLTTFLNPWANQFNSGYQLTQSLIAFGRGGIFGVGLGGSIQKLFYLPEAHTDFLFSVLAEELGLLGILCTIGLYVVMVGRTLLIGRRAQQAGFAASGFMAYGFAVWMAMQATVNMGVTAGLLPTKGLTLPFMSYGGSSMLIDCFVVALILRIDYEVRIVGFSGPPSLKKKKQPPTAVQKKRRFS